MAAADASLPSDGELGLVAFLLNAGRGVPAVVQREFLGHDHIAAEGGSFYATIAC